MMRRRRGLLAAAAALAGLGPLAGPGARAQAPGSAAGPAAGPATGPASAPAKVPAPGSAAPVAPVAPAAPVGELKSLGGERYQVGRIVVDKRAGRFSVPGRVHALGKPLEYLATAPGGMKEYESLFELDAGGSEFNLACILIGLEEDAQQVPAMQFRATKSLRGKPLSITVAWTDGGTRREVSAAQALLNADAGVTPESVQWVYVGSPTSAGRGRFAADDTGTLIGFIHDPNCIIESVAMIGFGAYGSVRGNDRLLPAKGSAIELVVGAPAQPR